MNFFEYVVMSMVRELGMWAIYLTLGVLVASFLFVCFFWRD